MANNKFWITADLKELFNKKKRAFRNGDTAKGIQTEGNLERADELNVVGFFSKSSA